MRAVLAAIVLSSCVPRPVEVERPRARVVRTETRRASHRAAPRPSRLEDDAAPDGAACESSASCGAEHCRGPAGCERPWACGAPRECGSALVSYCGCDGVTFYAPENCPGAPYTNVGPCAALGPEAEAEEGDVVEDNAICTSDADCASGTRCAGMVGCATFWTCVRRRSVRCGRETSVYCGCDGTSFTANAGCPGRPYQHHGECGAPVAEPPSTGGAWPPIHPRRELGDPR